MAMSHKSSRLLALFVFVALAGPSASTTPAQGGATANDRLDRVLNARASRLTGRSRVIIQPAKGASAKAVATLVRVAGGAPGRELPLTGAQVAELPNAALRALAGHPLVAHVSDDRPI